MPLVRPTIVPETAGLQPPTAVRNVGDLLYFILHLSRSLWSQGAGSA